MVGAKPLVAVDAHRRACDETGVLGDVIGPPDAQEAAVGQVARAVGVHCEGLQEHGDVVGVAAHDVEESVFAGDQGVVVDPSGVHLPESVFGPLRHEAYGPGRRLIELVLHLVADRGAVDDDGGLLYGFDGLVLGSETKLLEVLLALVIDGKNGATALEICDLGLLGDQRCPLVERDFVDPEVLLVVGEQADEWLTDRAGAHDVNGFHLRCLRAI